MSDLKSAIDAVMSYQWHGPREQLAALERLVKEARSVAQPAEPVAPSRLVALLQAAHCCDSIDAPGTWDEDDNRWRVDTHAGKFYGATLDEALADFWSSALQARDDYGNATEPDPFATPTAPQPVMFNGLTEAETSATASASGLSQLAGRAQPAEPVAGWRMVPADPTDAMVDATHHGQPVADIYRDMIAAAPPAPQPAGRALPEEQIVSEFDRMQRDQEAPMCFDLTDFRYGVRFAERAHGVDAARTGGGNAR